MGEIEGATAVGLTDVFVTKWMETSTTRQRAWSRQFGTPADDNFTDIAAQEGSIYVSGYTKGSFPGFTLRGATDGFLLRMPE